MPKPSSKPRWANAGGAIVEPTSGKKDVGWVAAERPAAQFLNWLFNLLYQWVDYIDLRIAATQTIVIPAGGSGATRSDGTDLDYHESSGGVTGVFGGDVFWAFGQYLRAGDTITGIRVIVDDGATDTLTASARRHSHQVGSASPGGAVAIGGSPSSNNSGNVQSLVVLSSGSEVVAAGRSYLVKVTSSGAGPMQVIAIEIDFVRAEL